MEGTCWIDLSYEITQAVPRLAKFAPPRIRKVGSMADDPFSITTLESVLPIGGADGSPARVLARPHRPG
jgi:kynurenine formamidase